MNRRPSASRREAGFSFIEILVVMGIITVLVSMVVVVVPMIQEKGRRAKSTDNVRTIILYLQPEGAANVGDWPQYNGKNFVLSVIATNKLNKDNTDNLAILFSPGDGNYTLKAIDKKDYLAVTSESLKNESEDFLKLTSYAGRRNRQKGHKLTAGELEKNALIVCDDDDGPLHHSKGMVLGYSNNNVKFATWADLGISAPSDPDAEGLKGLLGDEAPVTVNGDELKHMSSGN